MDTIPLQDAIRALRAEILTAREEASTEQVRFKLGPIEMEFQIVAKKELGGEAKIGFHIFAATASLGGSGKGADERTQRVKLTLNPFLIDDSGQQSDLDISRQNKDQRTSSPDERMLARGQ